MPTATCKLEAKHIHPYSCLVNPILHTMCLDTHALTLKSNSAEYYFDEKSSFLHTFLKFCCKLGKILFKFQNIYFQCYK
jgi:hypothetical protein